MDNKENRSVTNVVRELIASVHEVTSLAQNSVSERQICSEFAHLVDKFVPVLNDLMNSVKVIDHPPILKAVESLGKEFSRAKVILTNPTSNTLVKHLEHMVHDLGRSLGLVVFASLEVCIDLKDKIGTLHKDLMSIRFDASSAPSSSYHSGSIGGLETETEIVEEKISLSVKDIVLQLKYGNDEELRSAALVLKEFIEDPKVDHDWLQNEEVIPILFNRLNSSMAENRLTIICLLRRLALYNAENREYMADVRFLSILVKSLMREEEESREAVGLLSDLLDISTVRRQIGRIQGCIIMLVALLNGDDSVASSDARKLLNALSSNTQNALHMAEAGYFKPLVQYLKEGSDMSKILMATALSRMELTEQSRASLGKDGAVEPLVRMFITGKLEAKLSALNALQNLSSLKENVQLLINSGILAPLLRLLFSVTSVLMTLREPASAILARIAESEAILVNKDVAHQMLSLLNLSSPIVQSNLLQALNNIAVHPSASKIRRKMKENSAIQLLLPLLMETNIEIRSKALSLIYTLSKDSPEELTELQGEIHLNTILNIISSSTSDSEKAAAVGILSNFSISDNKTTDILKRGNLLPIIVSIMTSNIASTPEARWLTESITGLLIRFTNPSDKKLQLYAVENGVIPLLVKLLSSESSVVKCRAATSLAQLSKNSLSLRKPRTSKWFCVPSSAHAICEVHDGYCSVKNTFCLVKAGAIPPLIRILAGKERETDEAVLNALATILQDEIWENGSNSIAKSLGVQAIIKVLESGNVKTQEKALWILERIFRVEEHRVKYGDAAQGVLIDLAQKGDYRLKSTIVKLLAQLELLEVQSSYF